MNQKPDFLIHKFLRDLEGCLWPIDAIEISKKLEKLYSPLENENKCEADFEVEERKLTGNTNNVNTENPVRTIKYKREN